MPSVSCHCPPCLPTEYQPQCSALPGGAEDGAVCDGIPLHRVRSHPSQLAKCQLPSANMHAFAGGGIASDGIVQEGALGVAILPEGTLVAAIVPEGEERIPNHHARLVFESTRTCEHRCRREQRCGCDQRCGFGRRASLTQLTSVVLRTCEHGCRCEHPASLTH